MVFSCHVHIIYGTVLNCNPYIMPYGVGSLLWSEGGDSAADGGLQLDFFLDFLYYFPKETCGNGGPTVSLCHNIVRYIEEHQQETLALLKELAQIPAPSHHEDKRVAFCVDWLKGNGVDAVYTDEAKNVICPFGDCGAESPLVVFMAHSDVVFPDTEALPMHTEGDRLYCPGVGDDTVNVVHLLMAARYLAEKKLSPKYGGVLLVINSCEEGLGNLYGTRTLIKRFGKQIEAVYAFDCENGIVYVDAVGSLRYRVEIKTEGGHSYNNFGNRNAIVYLSSLITTLYQLKVPEKGTNTYNVGVIGGGTSVNTIAQQAEMLFEMRSDCRESLAQMDEHFHAAIEFYRKKGISVQVELVGERPCAGDVDKEKQARMVQQAAAAIRRYFDDVEIQFISGSTDCNIPLSCGIAAVAGGCFMGHGAHTREEYIEISSICPSQKVAFDMIMDQFCTDCE